MKAKFLAFAILLQIGCQSQTADKEKELLKKELELTKKELELKEKEIQAGKGQENSNSQASQKRYYSTPEQVLQAIIESAKTGDLSILKDLCDPAEKGDLTTVCICRLSPEYVSESSNQQPCDLTVDAFRSIYRNARIESVKVDKEMEFYATGTLINGNVPMDFKLVKRAKGWYLFDFLSLDE